MTKKKKVFVFLVAWIIFGVLVFYLTSGHAKMKEKSVSVKKSNYICTLSEEELKEKLTPEQYRIMRQNGTELPFTNSYWNNHKTGIYVDAITGEPLFASVDKFDSKSGWPSFSAPINKDGLEEKIDQSHGMERVEVRSKSSNSHLGHVFPDGPKPTGRRYCINSNALKFIPLEDMEKEGYPDYVGLFKPRAK
jgi:methionine-R-sulfoxide reductase